MIIQADKDGKVEIKIETDERSYGFNRKTAKVKRTVKMGSLSPFESLKVDVVKGEHIA